MKLDLTLTNLEGEDLEIAQSILKRNGDLYKSRPKKASGDAQYVWRMVAFALSDNPQHWCIPVTADLYLSDTYWDLSFKAKSDYRDRLNKIVEEVVDTVPVLEQPGTRRWAGAFGVI